MCFDAKCSSAHGPLFKWTPIERSLKNSLLRSLIVDRKTRLKVPIMALYTSIYIYIYIYIPRCT